MDAKMELVQEMGNNGAEVVSFDYDNNMVCGNKILEEDAKAIINRMETLEALSGLSAIKSGFYLLALKEKADLKALGYANIYDLAKATIGISRGVTSERLQVATRYRNTENVAVYDLDEKFKGFKYSALLELRKRSNEEIFDELGITADTKFLEIKEKLEPKPMETEQSQSDSSETEQSQSDSSETEQSQSDSSETELPAVDTFECEFTELPDYVKQTIRKWYRGQKKEVIGNLVITNLK